jgi:hypothetical protein
VARRTMAPHAPVAQGIEHRPPEPGAQVRILPGAQVALTWGFVLPIIKIRWSWVGTGPSTPGLPDECDPSANQI